jgi:hypothetical protein
MSQEIDREEPSRETKQFNPTKIKKVKQQIESNENQEKNSKIQPKQTKLNSSSL